MIFSIIVEKMEKLIGRTVHGLDGSVHGSANQFFPPRPQAREKVLGTRLRKSTTNRSLFLFLIGGILRVSSEDQLTPQNTEARPRLDF